MSVFEPRKIPLTKRINYALEKCTKGEIEFPRARATWSQRSIVARSFQCGNVDYELLQSLNYPQGFRVFLHRETVSLFIQVRQGCVIPPYNLSVSMNFPRFFKIESFCISHWFLVGLGIYQCGSGFV